MIEEDDVVATDDTFTDANEDVNSCLPPTYLRVRVRQSPYVETFYHQTAIQRKIESTNGKGYQYGRIGSRRFGIPRQ